MHLHTPVAACQNFFGGILPMDMAKIAVADLVFPKDLYAAGAGDMRGGKLKKTSRAKLPLGHGWPFRQVFSLKDIPP